MQTGRVAVGIDAGGSSTRWVARAATGARVEGTAAPVSGIDFLDPATEIRATAAIEAWGQALRSELGTCTGAARWPDDAGAVMVGMTGLTSAGAAAERIRNVVATHLGVPPSQVALVSDLLLAYRSAFEPGEGILVYAGTGSAAVHETADGTIVRAGGHGHLIDDAGGAFWIGRGALAALLREGDAHGHPVRGSLFDALYAHVGARSWSGVVDHVYRGGKPAVAGLAPTVAGAAEQGDAHASAILEAAGAELAQLAARLAARLDRWPLVALTGGVATDGSPLREAFAMNLPADVRVHRATMRPVDAALAMAEADGP